MLYFYFGVGDFYETFGEDAIVASKVLGIVLTKRSNGATQMELAGFPPCFKQLLTKTCKSRL